MLRSCPACILFCLFTLILNPIRAEQVRVDPGAVEVARWEGWGCSLSWWGVYSEKWSDERRQELCRLLFSTDQDALGFTVCRYNAGGTAPDADKMPYRAGGAVTVMLDRDGSWHPERDRGQIACLKLAKKNGANLFELFANSPPYWMLRNGNTRGGDGGGENLKPGFESAYADWLMATTEKLQQSSGIRFDYIAPFNEPSANWWNGERGNQEGCAFSPESQRKVLLALQAEIAQRKPSYRVAASDENGAREAYKTLDALTGSPDSAAATPAAKSPLFEKLNVHAYYGWEWQDRLRELAAKRGVPKLWMSEVTFRESGNAGFVPDDMRCALPITRSVVSDIKRLHCSAWVFWQPVEPLEQCLRYHYTYGLLPTSVEGSQEWNGRTFHPGESVTAKSFSALRQFSAFIRPDYKLVASGDFWTLAALSPDGRRVVLVVHNDAAQD